MDGRPIPDISDYTRRLWQWIEGETKEMPVTRETLWEFRYAVHGDAVAFYEAGRHSVAMATMDDALLALARLIVGDE